MSWVRLGLILSVLIQLGACSSAWEATQKAGQVIWDPDTPVGSPSSLPTQLTYSMVGDHVLNPNVNGESTPVVYQVFQLEDDSLFMAADFDAMVDDHETALGSNYLKHSDYIIFPDQFKFIEPLKIKEDTHYIGVMAQYSDPNMAQWKKVVKVKSIGREYHLLMFFTEHEIKLEIVE